MTGASACPQQLAAAAVAALPDIRLHAAQPGRSLGAGIGAGARRSAATVGQRARSFAARRSRCHLLRRAGVDTARILRTGGNAAMTHGTSVMGLAPSALLRQRRAAAATLACSSGGGDLDLTLALADGPSGAAADPAFSAHADPIVMWATAPWDSWLPRSSMAKHCP